MLRQGIIKTVIKPIIKNYRKPIIKSGGSGGGGGVVPTVPITSINANGWSAVYPSPPAEFDPISTPVTFTVARPGYNSSGSSVNYNHDITIMKRVREPFPLQSTLTAEQVALSDFVYNLDSISGATNSSTRNYETVFAQWLTSDLEIVSGSTFTARLAVGQAHARNGRPVAAVKFIATDGTNTVEQTVSTMTKYTSSVSGLSAPVFQCSIDLTTLSQSALCTLDVIIYPWRGVPFQASVDGEAYPSPNFSTLRFLNDKNGTYGRAIAYVNGIGGGTPQVSTNDATAAANPYATVAAAQAAITTFNNANFGRNNHGGGIIKLTETTHTFSNFKGTSGIVPLTVEAADPTKKTTTIFRDSGTNITNGSPNLLRLQNLTLRKTGASISFLDSNSTTGAGFVHCHNCIWDLNGQTNYGAWIYRVGRFTQSECSGRAAQNAVFSTAYKAGPSWGCSEAEGSSVFSMVACRGTLFSPQAAASPRPATIRPLIGWCFISNGTLSGSIVTAGTATQIGVCIAGTVVEAWGAASDPALFLYADSNNVNTENVLVLCTTVIGERCNINYNDATAPYANKSGTLKFNVFRLWNTKADLFESNSGAVNNWATRYKTGCQYNVITHGSNNGFGYTPGSWLGEIPGIGEIAGSTVDPILTDWVDDRSNDGSDNGNGDYTPGASTEIPLLPAALVPFPWDLFGTDVPMNGTAYYGAVQPS
jgi:hypothetical protein